jgi:PAS domain S-box-containing protein
MTGSSPLPQNQFLDGVWSGLAGCPAAVAVVGPDGRILRANPAFSSLLGRDRRALADLRITQLVHPADLPEGTPSLGHPLPPGRRQMRWVHRDGKIRRCLTQVWLVPADGAGSSYSIHHLEDVTHWVELAARLEESEADFRLLVQSITEYAIYHLDAEGRVSSWNAGAERIKGYRADEIIGRHYRVFFPPAEVAAGAPDANLARAAREGHASGEGWRRRKDGSEFWASWTLTALVRDSEVVGFAKITRDLTEERAAAAKVAAYAEDLERALREAREAHRFQEDLLAVAHHEFRTPLTALIGFSETLLEAGDRLRDADRRAALQSMASAGHRLTGLVDNLIALSGLHSATRALSAEAVRLRPAVRDAAAQAGTDLSTAVVDVPDDHEVTADPARLRQMIANLLTNAVLYGGGVVEVRARAADDHIALEVADAGPGVPPDFVPHLFERFSQASRGATRTAVGAGLGLASVKELAEAMGGQAAYAPNTPTGARFIIRLPRASPRR